MGFMPDGTFIPASIVAASRISDSDHISGKAVINFDKKKSRWRYKAMDVITETAS